MKVFKITCLDKLSDEYKKQAVNIFVDGFIDVLTFAKSRDELIKLFENSLVYKFVYVAICDDKIVGVMGVANNKSRAIKFQNNKFIEMYGKVKGSVLKKQLEIMMEKIPVKEDTDLYIDYLTTVKDYRGQGIGTKLLGYACDYIEGYEQCYIEVLSRNLNAKRLYENIGFTLYKKSYNPFIMLGGNGYPIMLKKSIKKTIF